MNSLITIRHSVIALLFLLLALFFYQHKDVKKNNPYIGSENCKDCHQILYQSWQQHTLHPHMFRPIESPDDIKGNFSQNDPAVTFKKEDIEFVIGNKWEQVYARMIDGEYYPLPAKWMITTQKWLPYKVDSWRQTPLSTQCNGCHTTGFNPDTYEFSEFGIGCEACHGPGSQHVQQMKKQHMQPCSLCHQNEAEKQDIKIIVSIKNSVCGQCHSRGQQVTDNEHMQTSFRFPLNFVPGDDLPENYQPSTQLNDKNKQHWWGNGLSKNRHQEFADFSVSKHSQALKLLKEKHADSRGELSDQCLSCHSADALFAKNKQVTLENAKNGLTCVVCHEPHGLNRTYKHLNINEHRCGLCHADSISIKAAETGKPHTPCPPSAATCADCHMPYIVKSGGAYPIRSHAFKIVPPQATVEYDIPNSCQNGGCHQDKSLDWAIDNFQSYYPDWQEHQ